MRKTNTHTTKSLADKQAYNKSLKEFNYDSTSDDKVEFNYTDDSKKDFSIQKNKVKRKKDWDKVVCMHFQRHWLKYVLPIAIAGISSFVYDARYDIGIIKTKIDVNKDEIKELKDNHKIIFDKIQEHSLKIQENSIQFKNFEKNFEEFKKKK